MGNYSYELVTLQASDSDQVNKDKLNAAAGGGFKLLEKNVGANGDWIMYVFERDDG